MAQVTKTHQTWLGDTDWTVTGDHVAEPTQHGRDERHVVPLQQMAQVTRAHWTWFYYEGRTVTGDYVPEPKRDGHARLCHGDGEASPEQGLLWDVARLPTTRLHDVVSVVHAVLRERKRHISSAIALQELHCLSGGVGNQPRIPQLVSRVKIAVTQSRAQWRNTSTTRTALH
ncbi:hypothetical protein FIBSPDRAFT_885558 [Athelia psychrophila]|uniref:Uncharacterized protein n=1 Tax=Athelia psychrophila TaxID=1759441 RepID=A0A166RVN0_9AGAM|nr:hypothetical protein FIBSPDRAFT_885558 [Fibularhizoctonia sp. CBS 109695]